MNNSKPFKLIICLALIALPWQCASAQHTINVPDDANLQTAIQLVDNGGVIKLAPGTYAAPSGGFEILNLDKHFTIKGAPGSMPVITSQPANTESMFLIWNTNPDPNRHVTFEGIKFSNGVSSVDNRAGAITAINTDITILNCRFTSNKANSPGSAGGAGGAIILRHTNASVLYSTFAGNSAWRSGGAIDARKGSRLTIHGSRFTSNRVNVDEHFQDSLGGAVFILNSLLRLTNTRFENNQAGFAGGAIYAYGHWAPTSPGFETDMVIANVTFAGNFAQCNHSSCNSSLVTVAGAVEAENNVTARIYHSRFLGNRANQGGAIQMYRSTMHIESSIFKGNEAVGSESGQGYGGAINVVSADRPIQYDPVNRQSASLFITDSSFQSHHGSTTTGGRYGGCIFVQGDYNSQYGQGGVPQRGALQDNRATMTVIDSIFTDCDVAANSFPSGIGGGIHADLTHLTINNSIFVNCDAQGGTTGTGNGGAIAIRNETRADLLDITIAGSTAAYNGAAIWAQGAELNLEDSQIFDNHLTSSDLDGVAVYTSPENIHGLVKATGLVQTTLFSGNSGPTQQHSIFDMDHGTSSSPNNLTQYSNNSFYPNDNTVYGNRLWGYGDTTFLNNVPNKSPTVNNGLTSAPIAGSIHAAPASTLSTSAPGDPPPPTKTMLAVAYTGGPATLDGNQLTTSTSSMPAIAGNHILNVGGSNNWVALITLSPIPVSAIKITPTVVASGTAYLKWQASSVDLVDQRSDQMVLFPNPLPATGYTSVTPDATTHYHVITIYKRGGDYNPARLVVAPDLLFFDGFETDIP